MNLSESRKRARTKAQTCGRGGVGDWERSTNMCALPSASDAGGELPLARGLSLLLCDGSERSDWEGWEGGK